MNIFLSWSTDYSKELAEAFREWIPYVLQGVKPFISSQDIALGAGWNEKINTELSQSELGIIFVTKENINSSWLNFESGALSMAFESASKVIPILFDDGDKNILFSKSPLKQFQSVLNPDKDGIKKLMKTLNDMLDNSLEDERLNTTFENFYPQLEKSITDLTRKYNKNVVNKTKKSVSMDDISLKLDAVMETVQKNSMSVRKSDIDIPVEVIEDFNRVRRDSAVISRQLRDIQFSSPDDVADKLEIVIRELRTNRNKMMKPLNYLKSNSVRYNNIRMISQPSSETDELSN